MPLYSFSLSINAKGELLLVPSKKKKKKENGSVHQNISAASGGCRPYHPPSLAPEWPRPYALFGMPPGSGFLHYDYATQRYQQGIFFSYPYIIP
jgi:hypothetical protein